MRVGMAMPILDTQRRVAVIGHIRLGDRAEDGRPRALKGFRFTSGRTETLDAVAYAYGGDVVPWRNPSTGLDEYEVHTTTAEVPVLIPPAELAFAQYYELWSAAGCERRCDGITETRGNEPRPCVCSVEGVRKCDATTRMRVLLPEVSVVFGVWQLTTTSYYASGELASAVELALAHAARRAEHLAQGVLRLEQRVARRPGEKPHRYTLPVLDVVLARDALGASALPIAPALDAGPSAPAVEAAASLTVVGLPEPAPRIDRGDPSPAPHMLDDDGRRAPQPPVMAHDVGVTTTVPHTHPLPAQDANGGSPNAPMPASTTEGESSGPNVVGAASGNNDARTKVMRTMFAVMAKLWPDITTEDRDERRAALAYVETLRIRAPEPAATSWADLTQAELSAVHNRLLDIQHGALKVEPIVGGYVFTTSSGRVLTVRQTKPGQWEHVLGDNNDG